MVYRILYEIVQDDEDAPYVHILHIRHGSRKPMTRAEARKIEANSVYDMGKPICYHDNCCSNRVIVYHRRLWWLCLGGRRIVLLVAYVVLPVRQRGLFNGARSHIRESCVGVKDIILSDRLCRRILRDTFDIG